MLTHVHVWLSGYSLSPERGTFLHPTRDTEQKVQEELENNRKKIEEKLEALSKYERYILDDLSEEEGDLNRLSGLALLLLAGKSLMPFAKSLLNWSFSNALNSDHSAPRKDFMDLVMLNRVDWSQTRSALLEACAELREAGVSATGKWAVVNILRATGQTDDSLEARALVASLTNDQDHFKGWRLIESYCATDPCDPASESPDNVMQTSEQYAAIDVSKLQQNMGQSTEDMFFRDARLCVARFKPESAVVKHKEFITDVLGRSGTPLRLGLLELRKHNALLTTHMAHEFINKWKMVKNDSAAIGYLQEENRLVSQYNLLLAFPFLNAKEQFDSLLLNREDEGILLDLLKITKPFEEVEFESLLGVAFDEGNKYKQYLLLLFVKEELVRLSTETCDYVVALLRSESLHVRTQAMRVIARSDNVKMLRSVAESDWIALDAENTNEFEAWYGSMVLLKAAVKGLITHDEAIKRISARLHGQAALMLDDNAVNNIAHCIDMSINLVIGLDAEMVAPNIDIQVYQYCPDEPRRVSVSDLEIKDNKDKMKRLGESNEAFLQRQKRNNDAYRKYEENLTKAKARIILDNIRLEEFAAIVEKNEPYGDRWYGLFMNIDESKLPTIHNLILLLAHALGEKAPEKARDLFCRIKDGKPLVQFTFGRSGVLLDSMAIWAGVRNAVMDELRYARLDRMRTDHDLANEVLVALLNGQQELLTEYIEIKLNKGEPAENARGIMVAGFSDQSAFNDEVIKRYENSAGLIGSAQKAAKYAYKRNVWARHWYQKMCLAEENNDFWRFSLLFLKIVDGRLAVWRSVFSQKGSPIMSFGSAIDSELKNRFNRCKNDREKKLFGSDAPALIFLEGADAND